MTFDLSSYMPNCGIHVYTIDFTSDIPFLFDEICCGANIPVLHPLNLGWGGGVIVIDQHSRKLTELQTDYRGFELCMAQHILKELMRIKSVPDYLPSIINEYARIKEPGVSPPQLSVGSFLIASICTTLMYNLCLKKMLKHFLKYILKLFSEKYEFGKNQFV